MKYYLIPINETRVIFLNERLKDLLYEKYPEVGELEINRTSIKLNNEEKEKEEKINKIDNKLDYFLDKNNIPKYLICYRFPRGDIYEIETNKDVTFKSEKIEEYQVSYEEAQEYYFRTTYDLRISEFIHKESTLVKEEVKPKSKSKTKTKTKTNKVSD